MEHIFSKEFVTADGNSFANKEHLNNIAEAGQLVARNVKLCLKNSETSYKVLGGISDMNFMVQNNLIPLAECGSDKWAILVGKTSPANISISRYFIHGSNMLKILSEGSGENLDLSDEQMILDLTTKYLSVPRDYYLIFEWVKVVDGDEAVIRTEIKKIRQFQVNNFSSNFGSGIVVMEQCSAMCQGIADYLETE